MKSQLIVRRIAWALLFMVAVPAMAQTKKESASPAQPRFDARIGKLLNQAVEELNAGKSAAARTTLKRINLQRASPYEVSRIEQLFAAIDQGEEKYGAAREHLEKALASGGLNDKELSATRFQIAALFLAEERWADAVRALEAWFASEPKPNSVGYYSLAVAHYQLGNYAAAAGPAQKAVDLAGDDPQESWLQLLLAIRVQREEYGLALPTLMRLLQRSPEKKPYWVQGASMALSMERYDSAADLLQLAYTADLLTETSEIQQLAEVLVHVGIPNRAARIFQDAMTRKQIPETAKAYEFLANSWIAAREYDKAIAPLGRAGELASSGEPYVRLAEVHFQQGNFSQAAAVLRKALGKGNLKRPGKAHLLMGISLFNEQKWSEARSSFERARGHEETRKQADEWLNDPRFQLAS